ncbi:hypothetical protein HanIR_Chr01g0031011 [Helianthus annuus]|nr:hypothetical protein HanIR_Chr01g0031011 [Helianthus annuus]
MAVVFSGCTPSHTPLSSRRQNGPPPPTGGGERRLQDKEIERGRTGGQWLGPPVGSYTRRSQPILQRKQHPLPMSSRRRLGSGVGEAEEREREPEVRDSVRRSLSRTGGPCLGPSSFKIYDI